MQENRPSDQMLLSLVVAVATNGAIGMQNQLPWRLPADLRYFRKLTTGHCVLMGRNTFESIGKPLPNRTNIVVSRNPDFSAEGILPAQSLEEALQIARQLGETEAFLIGGGQLYAQALPLADRLYLTEVQTTPEADTFFPLPLEPHWKETSREEHTPDQNNLFSFAFVVYQAYRKANS